MSNGTLPTAKVNPKASQPRLKIVTEFGTARMIQIPPSSPRRTPPENTFIIDDDEDEEENTAGHVQDSPTAQSSASITAIRSPIVVDADFENVDLGDHAVDTTFADFYQNAIEQQRLYRNRTQRNAPPANPHAAVYDEEAHAVISPRPNCMQRLGTAFKALGHWLNKTWVWIFVGCLILGAIISINIFLFIFVTRKKSKE